jgi:transcriptional regulator with XRE-family HTH domain
MKAAALKRRRRVVREDGPDPIDLFVGSRVRERRLQGGLSQLALAERLGVSFQQVQKYETARNRISASTLFRLSHVLCVPPDYFFQGCAAPEATNRKKPRKARRNPKVQASQTGLKSVSDESER